MRPIAITVPDEFCNEENHVCELLGKDKFGICCEHFMVYLEDRKSDDGITYDVIPCTTCLEGGFKEDREKLKGGE